MERRNRNFRGEYVRRRCQVKIGRSRVKDDTWDIVKMPAKFGLLVSEARTKTYKNYERDRQYVNYYSSLLQQESSFSNG